MKGKFFKRSVSAVLALLLLVSGMWSTAFAADPDDAAETKGYTAALQDTEHGLVSFKGEDTELRSKTFQKGESVSLTWTADEGYIPEFISARGIETNTVYAYESVTDVDSFTFEMPEEEVTVFVIFTEEKEEAETSDFTDRTPLYDYEALQKALKETGAGLADTEAAETKKSAMRRVAANQTVYVSEWEVASARVDVVQYHRDSNGNVTGWTFLDHWGEGIFGTNTNEWVFCADPNVLFKEGWFTARDASTIYNESTLKWIAGYLWYFDTYQNPDGHIPYQYEYMLKQCIIWEVLCNVNGWYSGATLECGNNIKCTGGAHCSTNNYISGHCAEIFDWGRNTVLQEWDKISGSGVILEGNGQPLSQWSYSYNPQGYAKIKKVSANPTITDGNSCYSLEGAKYGIWKNKECTEGTGVSFTLDASGNSNTLTLTPGDYYVREYEAPKGYALDKTVYKVTVTSGQTTTLTVKDNPTMDPVGVLLGKVDAETNKNKPQGSATLEGALFEVKFYDVLSETDPVEVGKTAKRSWVFRTNENGFCEYQTNYLESGDELYKAMSGDPSLPIGTITIQEIQAPEGYLLNSEVYVIQITSENDGSEFVYTYNEPIIPENTLDLNIVKVEKDVEQAIPGAVFRHTLPDGSTEEVTTDEEGKAAFKGLTWGEHTVQEVSVPEGYTINPGKVTFTVEKGNKITVTSNTATDAKGNMTFTVQDDGCALLEVEDTLAPYELLLHKQNQFGKVLEGAEFELYSDKKCTKVVSKGTTKKDGTVSFSKLTVGTTYYLKETKAPEGYRIPVNADGSAIVYEIRTESDPLKDQFEYYVNGKKYTSKTGKFAITGTKAERVVNLTVLNNTGVKLPETGTHAGLLLFLLGIVCMAGIIVYHIKKRKNEGKKNEKK